MTFEIATFDAQLKVGEWECVMGVRRLQDKKSLLLTTPGRNDMLLVAYQGEHIRYHG